MAVTSINTGIYDPLLLRALKRIEQELLSQSPIARYQYKDVTFNSTANADTIIVHTLEPQDPDDVDWEVLGISFAAAPATAPVIYKDTSATRRAWGDGYIVLRCNVASASATLRLTVRNT